MKKFTLSVIVLAALVAAAPTITMAGSPEFRVTITNLTQDQSFTPILVASHKKGVKLFRLGSPATGELETLAEEGNTGPLTGLLLATPGVGDVMTGGGLLAPGATKTVSVEAGGVFRYLSVAAMLIPTNDAFFALNGVKGPRQVAVFNAPAYDAGTEDNDELCASIPGPPFLECGGPGGGGTPPGGEGFVHIHNGMHGHGDFDEATRDWRNPVARIVVEFIDTDDEDDD